MRMCVLLLWSLIVWKVAPGGAGRCCRPHNADGAMDSWLESAVDLVETRKEDGTRDPNCAVLFKELKKREMESKKLESRV